MNEEKRTRLISLGLTLLLHLLVVVLLLLIVLPKVQPEEESGVLVMVGLVDESTGDEVPAGAPMQQPEQPDESAAEPEPATPQATPQPASSSETPLIAQTEEPAPAIATPKPKKETVQPTPDPAKVEAERQRRAEEERKKQQAQKINNLASAAFGQSGSGGSASSAGTGTSGSGAQGSPNGNSTKGASQGSPGWGSYDLGGRGLLGSLPRPNFNVNASGDVVISITVDASGKVVSAVVNPKGTTTSDASLREAAKKAASSARFEAKSGVSVQYGTITYRFDSNN
jgi:TonB family protein